MGNDNIRKFRTPSTPRGLMDIVRDECEENGAKYAYVVLLDDDRVIDEFVTDMPTPLATMAAAAAQRFALIRMQMDDEERDLEDGEE